MGWSSSWLSKGQPAGVLSSLWGAGLPFLGGLAQGQGHKPLQRFAGNRSLQGTGFAACRDLLGTDICRTWVVWGQHFPGDRGFQGTGVFRGQSFAGDRDLQGFAGAGVHREQKFAGDRDLQGGCKLPPSQAPGLCAWLLALQFWLCLPPPRQCQGFWVVTGL